MRKYRVYRRVWGREVDKRGHWSLAMEPVMAINAKTAEAALRIAKQKGIYAPIIGEANEVAA